MYLLDHISQKVSSLAVYGTYITVNRRNTFIKLRHETAMVDATHIFSMRRNLWCRCCSVTCMEG